MDLPTILVGVFAVIATVAAMLAAVIWGNVKGLRDANADLRLRVTDLEAADLAKTRRLDDTKREKDQQIADLHKENVDLKNSLHTITETITGEVHWEALTTLLADHHSDALRVWERDREIFSSLATTLTEIKDAIAESTKLIATLLREERENAD